MSRLPTKGRPTRIPTEMNDEEKNEQESRKKCGICRQHDHNINNCPNISPS